MKKRNEDDPDILGGLGDLLPAEVLKKVNELLEQFQQKGHPNQGSKIELVYVAPGAQHIGTQINIGDTCPKPKKALKEDESSATVHFDPDTPLSALFRENHHKGLRLIIDSWRPYLVGDDPNTEALALSHFEFDKDQIYSNKVYRDLCELDVAGALKVPLSQLARYLADHSNLSRSYATLYQQLKYFVYSKLVEYGHHLLLYQYLKHLHGRMYL